MWELKLLGDVDAPPIRGGIATKEAAVLLFLFAISYFIPISLFCWFLFSLSSLLGEIIWLIKQPLFRICMSLIWRSNVQGSQRPVTHPHQIGAIFLSFLNIHKSAMYISSSSFFTSFFLANRLMS